MPLSKEEIEQIAKTTAEEILSRPDRLVVDPTNMVCSPELWKLKDKIEKFLNKEVVTSMDYKSLANQLDYAGWNVRGVLNTMS